MVCPGDFLGFSSLFLEVSLGKVEAEEDLLLPLDGGPQRATSRELVETDGTGGSVSDVFTGRGVPETLPLELLTGPGSVEGSHGDSSAGCTGARSDHLGGLLLVQHRDGTSLGLRVLTSGSSIPHHAGHLG